jgi:hypothetical protein
MVVGDSGTFESYYLAIEVQLCLHYFFFYFGVEGQVGETCSKKNCIRVFLMNSLQSEKT